MYLTNAMFTVYTCIIRRIKLMFVETIKTSIVVKALVSLIVGIWIAKFIKEDLAPGDNHPHVFMKR